MSREALTLQEGGGAGLEGIFGLVFSFGFQGDSGDFGFFWVWVFGFFLREGWGLFWRDGVEVFSL